MPLTRASKKDLFWVALITASVISAVVLRFLVRNYESEDYRTIMGDWYQFIQMNGGIFALRYNFSNYTPLYLLMLVIVNALLPHISSLYGIKIVSVVFDFVLALAGYLSVRSLLSNRKVAWVALISILLCPTVIANSALWGQVDSIYTAFLLLAIWRLLKHDTTGAVVFYGISFSLKLQAIFLLPVFIFLTLERTMRLRDWFILPAVYLTANLPAILMGRSPLETLMLYYGQAGQYNDLTMFAPNMYQWLPAQPHAVLLGLGIAAAGVFTCIYWYILRRTHTATIDQILIVSMTSLVAIPFFLPNMHERYFYPADVVSIITACAYPRLRWLPACVIGASSMAYLAYLNGIGSLPIATGLMLIALVGLLLPILQNSPHNTQTDQILSVCSEVRSGTNWFAPRFFIISVAIFTVSALVGPYVRETMDHITTAGILSYRTSQISVHSPQAYRCGNTIHVAWTWAEAQDPLGFAGAHIFVHAVDTNDRLVAQVDWPTKLYLTRYSPVIEKRDLSVNDASTIRDIKLGLYQYDADMTRYTALRKDGSSWPDNAITVPVADGVCSN